MLDHRAAHDRRCAWVGRIPRCAALALTLLGFTVAVNGASLILLIRELLANNSTMSGRELLFGALIVWMSNLIAFSLWYWELDRGGPRARELRRATRPTSSSRR